MSKKINPLNNFAEIGERMKTVRERLRLNQSGMGEELGISGPSYQAYEKGKNEPSTGSLLIIARKLGVSLDWLLTGEERSREPEPVILTGNDHASKEWIADHTGDYRAIGLYEEGRLAAGPGGLAFDPTETPTSQVIVYRPELKHHGRHQLAAARVGGSSMEPTIPASSIVVVDLDDKQFANNKIFAVNEPESDPPIVTIKRVQKWSKGYLLIPDNLAAHTPLDGGDHWPSIVVGRVIWMWRSLGDA